MIKVYFDGAYEPNPNGIAAYGAVIYLHEEKIHEISYRLNISHTTNNIAEYCGLISSLKYLISKNLQHNEIYMFGDSQLVINQMKDLWQANKGSYMPYYERAIQYRDKFTDIHFEWIPKERNLEADKLSRRCI